MLTDVFFRRYAGFHLKDKFDASDAAFLVQGHRLLVEQLFPDKVNGYKDESANDALKDIHNRLSMEIGVHALAPISVGIGYSYILKQYLCAPFQETYDVTAFLMQRVSLLELGFQLKEAHIVQDNANLPQTLLGAHRVPPHVPQSERRAYIISRADWIKTQNEKINQSFKTNVEELNTRFRQAGYPFHYHNRFIQISRDALTLNQTEKPFWDLVADPIWANVDIDMKNAIDLRDNNGPNPAFHATKALESTIKIISEQKGANTEKEKSAYNYIDNLRSERAGRFIEQWEADALKALFKDNRNPFGHGPCPAPMPQLSPQQTDWVIENCMSWIKSLVRRL